MGGYVKIKNTVSNLRRPHFTQRILMGQISHDLLEDIGWVEMLLSSKADYIAEWKRDKSFIDLQYVQDE